MLVLLAAVATGAMAQTTYKVSVKEGTDDADNWTIAPAEATTTGVAAGTTVTATYGGTKKVKSVKAVKKAAVPVTAITLNKTETSIKVGATETLSVTEVLPDNATDKTYTWKTSDESKATVDQDGKVTAVAAGTVTIYAEANDGSGVKGNCTVTVTPAISFNKVRWDEADKAPANFISVSQTAAKAAADAEKTRANAPGYVCIYALEGGSYKWFDSQGRSGQGSDLGDIVWGDAFEEVGKCDQAGYQNCIWFTVSQ